MSKYDMRERIAELEAALNEANKKGSYYESAYKFWADKAFASGVKEKELGEEVEALKNRLEEESKKKDNQIKIVLLQASRLGDLKAEAIELMEEIESLKRDAATLKEDNKRWFNICKNQLGKIKELEKLLETTPYLYKENGVNIDVKEGAVVITVRR